MSCACSSHVHVFLKDNHPHQSRTSHHRCDNEPESRQTRRSPGTQNCRSERTCRCCCCRCRHLLPRLLERRSLSDLRTVQIVFQTGLYTFKAPVEDLFLTTHLILSLSGTAVGYIVDLKQDTTGKNLFLCTAQF